MKCSKLVLNHQSGSDRIFQVRRNTCNYSYIYMSSTSREGAMKLQHFSHQHPLFSLDKKVHSCELCSERVSGPFYGCKKCRFYLHKSCALLSHEMQHPLHPKHPLTLIKLPSMKKCDCCRARSLNFKYNCSNCEFDLCIKCASLPLTKEVDIHDHPLTLMRKSFPFTCDYCVKPGKGMFYLCVTCSFMVHPQCTLSPRIERPLIVKAEIHDHPLTLARKLISFTCDACGKEGMGMFYFCTTCSFVSHLDCVSLPSTVKVIRHDHPLNLAYSLLGNQFDRRVCQLCVKAVKMDYGVYYCSSCDFVSHLHCATRKEDKDATFVRNSKDEESIKSSTSVLEHEDPCSDYESVSPSTFVVKKIKLGLDGIEIPVKIKHFSHEQHDLNLDDKLENNEKCDGCMQPIFPPFYACTKCGFFLHKACVELPRTIRHPLHGQHSLILRPLAPNKNNIFTCKTCRRDCNGFTYNCDECQFGLDVQCSLISDTITHASHEHQLILSSSSDGKECSCCDSRVGYKFRCADCIGFTLDFKCLTLPHTVRYENHEHPFTLYCNPEDDSGEHYCDICEKERDPKRWFYYCADCYYPAHPECILGIFPNLKFGKIYAFDFHQHPLTLVQKTKDHPLCEKCGNPCTDVAYVCGKCNFNFHKWCLRK